MKQGEIQILIIEDEDSAARTLQNGLKRIWKDRDYKVIGVLETVSESLEFLRSKPEPDLILMDIQLSDGISFDLFQNYQPNCPIIFTTAYDQYAIKAFEMNGLHYLLKPITDQNLQLALDRYDQLKKEQSQEPNYEVLLQALKPNRKKEHFLVYSGDSMKLIPTKDIALFHKEDRQIVLLALDGSSYRMSGTLDEIQAQVDDYDFYRANRQFLIHKSSIEKIDLYFNQKLIVQTKPNRELRIIISKEKASDFKMWLER